MTLILATREAELVLLFAGQLACEGCNFALKRVIREHRPGRFAGLGYGMPSSHAQYMFFLAVAGSLFLARRFAAPHSRRVRVLVLAGLWAAAGLTAWSRVYLGYHSVRQVVVGAAVGAVLAGVWFGSTAWARAQGWLDRVLEWQLVRAVRVRDLAVAEQLDLAGWEKWERISESRRVKGRRD